MVDFGTFTQPGLVEGGGGDPVELFLEKWSGEVHESFKKRNVAVEDTRMHTLTKGKQHMFPATGELSGAHHLPGLDIRDAANGIISSMPQNERLIYLDRPFVSVTFLDEIEEAMSDWSVRGPIARSAGFQISDDMDIKVLKLIAKGAGSTGVVTGQGNGTILSGTTIPEIANADTDGSALMEAMRRAQLTFDQKSLPEEGRVFYMAPAQYTLAIQQTEFLTKDWNPENGSLAKGEIYKAFGFDIKKTNNMPTTNTSGGAAPVYQTNGLRNDYRVDARNCVGLAAIKGVSVGTLRLGGLKAIAEQYTENLGGILGAYTTGGHGVLREEACLMVITATP